MLGPMREHDGHENLKSALVPFGVQFLVETGAGIRREVCALNAGSRNRHGLSLCGTKINKIQPITYNRIAENIPWRPVRINSRFILEPGPTMERLVPRLANGFPDGFSRARA